MAKVQSDCLLSKIHSFVNTEAELWKIGFLSWALFVLRLDHFFALHPKFAPEARVQIH